MPSNSVFPAPLNPVDDPLAAAQQMTLAMIASGQYKLPQTPGKAAESGHELLKSVTDHYLQFRTAYRAHGR